MLVGGGGAINIEPEGIKGSYYISSIGTINMILLCTCISRCAWLVVCFVYYQWA